MTSAPVKDVSSLMNFVGSMGAKSLTSTGGMSTASGFGEAMSKAQGRAPGADNSSQIQTRQDNSKATATSATKNNRRDAIKAEGNTHHADGVDAKANRQEAIEKAAEQVVEAVAQELGVTPDDVAQAMEELGLSVFSLFDPAQLTQLILQLSGADDVTALLTDETLFGNLQNLLQLTEGMKSELIQDMNVNTQELQEMIEQGQQATMQEQDLEQANAVLESETAGSKEKTPEIIVEVEHNGQTVKLSTDENGNVQKTIDVEQETIKAPELQSDRHGQESNHENKGREGESFHADNPLLDALLQNKVPSAEITFEQTSGLLSRTTQDIMNQIMDYMKIQLKPGMEQLEMQLHPESLGTVHVQLTTKGGEVTAQFHVQNETVKAAIESQLVELKENLKDQGVKVEAVEVTVESHGFESNLWQGQGREEDAASEGNRKTPRRININELDGLFEEEASEEELLAAKVMEMNGNTVDYTA